MLPWGTGLVMGYGCMHVVCVQVATGNTSLVQGSSPTSLGLPDPTRYIFPKQVGQSLFLKVNATLEKKTDQKILSNT